MAGACRAFSGSYLSGGHDERFENMHPGPSRVTMTFEINALHVFLAEAQLIRPARHSNTL